MHLCPAVRRRISQKKNRRITRMGPHSAFNHYIVANSSSNVISPTLATTPAHIFDGTPSIVHHNSIPHHLSTPFFSRNRLGFIFVSAEAPTGRCSLCVVYRAVIALRHYQRISLLTYIMLPWCRAHRPPTAYRPLIHPNPIFFSLFALRLTRARVCYTHTKAVLQSSANSKPHPLYLCYLFAFICINKLI
uniref:Uncharacterized protein n=1 Tax=Hydatigena taeniaeformis TaxID=6205 RepID=A0A0R3WPI4_HYDTA